MTLEERTKQFLESKRREWNMDNPGQPTTKRAFADWLGVSEWVYSDFTNDMPRKPTKKQLRKIARRYPEIYDSIGMPQWKERPEAEERKQRRLDQLVSLAAQLNDDDLAKLEQMTRLLNPDDGEGDKTNDAPFRLVPVA